MWLRRPAHAAWSFSALWEISLTVSSCLRFTILLPGVFLPDAFAIIGIARREMSNDAFRSDLARALRRFAIRGIDERITGRLLARATYVNGDADDSSTYERLDRELAQVERACATGGNRLFYLATPPSAFAPISRHLGRSSIAC